MTDKDTNIIEFPAVKKARKDLEEFLAKNPKAREYQAEIDKMLEKIGDNPINRMVALSTLISDKASLIGKALKALNKKILEQLPTKGGRH